MRWPMAMIALLLWSSGCLGPREPLGAPDANADLDAVADDAGPTDASGDDPDSAPADECDGGSAVDSGNDPDPANACLPNPCAQSHRTTCVLLADGEHRCDCDPGYGLRAERCLPDCVQHIDPELCQAARASFEQLVSANGHGALVVDATSGKAHQLLEHIYRYRDEDEVTRDLLWDSYLGLRTSAGGVWLNEIEPVFADTLEQTGIIWIRQRVGTLRVDTFIYAPWELARPGLVLIGQLTNEGQASEAASLYSLHNYHLGWTGAQDPVNPDFTGERMIWRDAAAGYVETGPAGMMAHLPLQPADHHGCTPDNPWQALQAGLDLADTADSQTGDDRVAGFQKDFELAPGESGWFGVVTAWAGRSSEDALLTELRTTYAGLDAQAALNRALAEWESWRGVPPPGLDPVRAWLWRQSEATLRQGQVWESADLSRGQIVASLPPGAWNICWVRDMVYAIVALVHAGHLPEARAALRFVLEADSGHYQDGYVGVPYQVSIARYVGRGKEETDFNEYGPNIEFDGFGLFLWALWNYEQAASAAVSLVPEYWPVLRDRVADALVALVDPVTGLLAADSSIWEVHFNGQQKHYGYTSLAAAAGLCLAAELAERRGEVSSADLWRQTARNLNGAISEHLLDPDGALASSAEELLSGAGYRDASIVEAFNWNVFDPQSAVALASRMALDSHLRTASGLGYFRNDDGGWYDSQEWVFVDLRAAAAWYGGGMQVPASGLLDWISAQALANRGLLAELHDPQDGRYLGEVPMVGFGAGAFVLAVLKAQDQLGRPPACRAP